MTLKTLSLVLGLVGFALLLAGIGLLSVPIALMVAGVLMLAYAALVDRAAAEQARRQPDKPQPSEG